MCQLTYVDFRKDYYLSPWYVKWLLTANSLEGHKDGFGYCLEKDHAVIKTEQSATSWLSKYFTDTLGNVRNTNGMYHVRRASVNTKEIKANNAHPFRDGNLVIAHNGTLELQTSPLDLNIKRDMFEDDMIDSQKFLVVLNYFYKKSGKVLDESVIKSALQEFSGTYVILMRDITTNTLWIAKDDTKELSIALFSSMGNNCGIIINTRHYMVDLMSDIILDSKKDPDLSCKLEVFNKNLIMKYELGSYVTPSVACDFRPPVKRYGSAVVGTQKHGVATGGNIPLTGDFLAKKEPLGSTFFEDMKKCFLTLEDLFLLYEIRFGKSILEMDEKDYPDFIQFIGKISKVEWTERRSESLKAIFEQVENSIMSPVFTLCALTGKNDIVFPLIANGKSTLESLAKPRGVN